MARDLNKIPTIDELRIALEKCGCSIRPYDMVLLNNYLEEYDKIMVFMITNEDTRMVNELDRQHNETVRISNETNRMSNESNRITVEISRVNAENNRVTIEAQRVDAENTRINNENIRINNENIRKNNETERKNNETERKNDEDVRIINETNRVDVEILRVTAENGRVLAETGRVAAENSRVTIENDRVLAETGRVNAENTRVLQETVRQANTQTVINNANTATQKANTAASLADTARLAITDELDTIASNIGTSDYILFSASSNYSIGDIVRYDDKLYKFTSDHSAGSWLGTDVELASINSILKESYGDYISNAEYIRAYIDSENNFLWGIKVDGSIEFAKGVPMPIKDFVIQRLQPMLSDIQTLFSDIQTLQESIAPIATTFKYISNTEWLAAVVDTDDRILFGIRANGETYVPNREMLTYIQNDEYKYAILDNDKRVIFAIKSDGTTYMPKGVPEESKVIFDKFLAIFNDATNIPEYIAVTVDANGKIIEGIKPDGKHYYAKQDLFDKTNDVEGRLEITVDADDRIISYRSKDGTKYETNLHAKQFSAEQMLFNDDNARSMRDVLQNIGFSVDMPNDFSKSDFVELPIPRVCAYVRLMVPRMPTSKTADIEGYLEYYDKDGNYFNKPIILNSQGSSSMSYIQPDGSQGNLSFDFTDDCKVKFGAWVPQDSFHIKKYYIDSFRGQCVVGYHLMEQVYQTKPYGQKKPYDTILQNDSVSDSFGKFNKDYNTGALCHPDGFPIVIYVNTGDEDVFYGVYAWCLKKHRDNYYCNKSNPNNIILDGNISADTLFGGNIQWNIFEIRNPKGLIDIDGNKYDGDLPKELSDTDAFSVAVKSNVIRLSGSLAALSANSDKSTFEQYFLPNPFIDYFLISQVIYNIDGFLKNWIWCTWDGQHWTPTLYDVDSIFGMMPIGTYVNGSSASSHIITEAVTTHLANLYSTEIRARYKELRDKGVFTVENITGLLTDWLDRVGYQNLKDDLDKFNKTPSYRNSYLNSDNWQIKMYSWNPSDHDYDDTKTYNIGDTCYQYGYQMTAISVSVGVPPFSQVYDKHPQACGFYNSPARVFNWLVSRIAYLDSVYNYE